MRHHGAADSNSAYAWAGRDCPDQHRHGLWPSGRRLQSHRLLGPGAGADSCPLSAYRSCPKHASRLLLQGACVSMREHTLPLSHNVHTYCTSTSVACPYGFYNHYMGSVKLERGAASRTRVLQPHVPDLKYSRIWDVLTQLWTVQLNMGCAGMQVELSEYTISSVTEGPESLAFTRCSIRPVGRMANEGFVIHAQVCAALTSHASSRGAAGSD